MSEYHYIANLKGDTGDTGDKGDPGIGSHGVIDEEIDLDQWRDDEHMGHLTARGRNLLNRPEAIGEDDLCNVEIYRSANNGATQRISSNDKVFTRNGSGNLNWWPWSAIPTSPSVTRIFTSTDAEYPLEDGDLLVLTPTPTFFTDFSGPTGDIPAGWSSQWEDTGGHLVVSEPLASGGRALHFPGGEYGVRRALSWDVLTPPAEGGATVEVVLKWRGGSSAQPRIITEASGTPEVQVGRFGGVSSGRNGLTMGSYTSDGAISHNGEVGTHITEEGEWWGLRVRYEPLNRIVMRMWRWAEPEPQEWEHTGSISTEGETVGGWTGVMSFDSAWTQYDWIGASIGGGRAPKGA